MTSQDSAKSERCEPERAIQHDVSDSIEFDEAVAALKESLADLAAGERGVPYEEFLRQLTQRRRKNVADSTE